MLDSGRVGFRVSGFRIKRFRSQGLGFKVGPLGWTLGLWDTNLKRHIPTHGQLMSCVIT